MLFIAVMMEGWQGWWTSASYRSGLNAFAWGISNQVIEDDDPHWGFKKVPYEDTCVWVLQISVYNYTWGNYDCQTRTGFICEIELPIMWKRPDEMPNKPDWDWHRGKNKLDMKDGKDKKERKFDNSLDIF